MQDFLIQLGGKRDRYFKRSALIKRSDQQAYENFIRRYDNTDVYYSVFSYADEDLDNCMLYGPIYFDLDADIETEESFQQVKRDTLLVIAYLQQNLKIPEKYIELYFSGAKGFHILVQPEVFGAHPEEHLNIVYKAIALIANKNTITKPIDPGIYDRKRLFRIPGSINGKTGLYKAPLSADKLRRCDLESVRKHARKPRRLFRPRPRLVNEARNKYYELLYRLYTAKKKTRKAPQEKFYFEEILPCVEQILENGVADGERNIVSVGVASSLFQSGKDYDEILGIMENWDLKNDPPVQEEDPNEIARTVASAHKMFNSERGYGCSHFKSLGYCVEDCKLNKRRSTI